MLVEGVIVTVIGMAVVFVFLELMVILMQVMAAVVRKFVPQTNDTEAKPVSDTVGIAIAIAAVAGFHPELVRTNGCGSTNEIAAAITAAKLQQTSRG